MSHVEFLDPKQNDFQWRNLYLKQFSLCTYPPPPPKNPSTTDAVFPQRRDAAAFIGTVNSDGDSDDDTRTVGHSMASLRNKKSSSIFSLNDVVYQDAAPPKKRLSTDSILEELFPRDNVFTADFFDFLTRRKSNRTGNDIYADNNDSLDGSSNSQTPSITNPKKIPREIFDLQRDAWALLMDNRPMAWLEREASDKYRSAASVRHRLLELATGSSGHLASSLSGSFDTFAPGSAPTISEEEALNRVYESFEPFFAVISKPAALRKLKDQFIRSRDAQRRNKDDDGASNVVGVPMFSQFATWREAYQNRIKWNCTPFSFFLIHDPSYNFAHIAAMFVLLELVASSTHEHTAHCTDFKHVVITMESSGYRLASTADARRAVEQQQNVCPLHAMEQLTENIFLAFEQSTARSALTMALTVCSFLTDTVLDAETARRFLSRDALRRQSTFVVPGMNVTPRATNHTNDNNNSNNGKAASVSFHHDTPDANAEQLLADSTMDGNNTNTATTTSLQQTMRSGFADLLAFKCFSDVEFESLFSLSFWFIDSSTANANVPIDYTLIPLQRGANLVSPSVADSAYAGGGHDGATSAGGRPTSSKSRRGLQSSRGGSAQQHRVGTGRLGSRGKSSRGGAGTSAGARDGGNNASNRLNNNGGGGGGGGGMPISLPQDHTYIPGKRQQFTATSGIVEVVALYEQHREAYMASRTAAALSGISRRKKASSRGGPMANGTTEANFSVSTTFLSTPLIFICTYMRLHGAPWLNHLISHLVNILRRESVLLYVNRFDLDEPSPESLAAAQLSLPVVQSFTGFSNQTWNNNNNNENLTGAAMNAAKGSPPIDDPQQLLSINSARAVPPLQLPSGVRAGMAPLFGEDSAGASQRLEGVGERPVSGQADDTLDHMERLEDLICQDIQFVMTEFFSALYGKRSATRLPQGITSLLTLFCSQIHMHLLGNMIVTDNLVERPGDAAKKVDEYVRALKRKRAAAKNMRGENIADSSVNRLISNIEQCHLAKFLLFDCWIIPALSNAVQLGYIAESSPLHLRWNIDAFARYLKILVNSPFVAADQPQAVYPEPPPQRGKAQRARPPFTVNVPKFITGIYDVSSGTLVRLDVSANKHRAYMTHSTTEHDGNSSFAEGGGETPPLPRLPVAPSSSSSSKTRPGSGGDQRGESRQPASQQKRRLSRAATPSGRTGSRPGTANSRPNSGTSRSETQSQRQQPRPPSVKNITWEEHRQNMQRSLECKSEYYRSMESATWEELSSSLQNLNETLGIKGYDPQDDLDPYAADDSTTHTTVMHVLDLFCKRSSTETATNVVVNEFEVLPSMAASCVEKVYDFVTGSHPLVQQAINANVVPSKFVFSPYLACLNGVLLHPRTAASALDNVYYNSKGFYHSLMRPLQDRSMLEMLTALMTQGDELPMVDCNAVLPYVALLPPINPRHTRLRAQQAVESARRETAMGLPPLGPTENAESGDDANTSLALRWQRAARSLRKHQGFLTTGGIPAQQRSYERVLRTARPTNPTNVLAAGGKAIEESTGIVPLCFDPWWRAMTAALSVKVMSVLTECTSAHSDNFLQWCEAHEEQSNYSYKLSADAFVRRKGKEVTENALIAEANRQRAERQNRTTVTIGEAKSKKKRQKKKTTKKSGSKAASQKSATSGRRS